jgi:hypothetical protein
MSRNVAELAKGGMIRVYNFCEFMCSLVPTDACLRHVGANGIAPNVSGQEAATFDHTACFQTVSAQMKKAPSAMQRRLLR